MEYVIHLEHEFRLSRCIFERSKYGVDDSFDEPWIRICPSLCTLHTEERAGLDDIIKMRSVTLIVIVAITLSHDKELTIVALEGLFDQLVEGSLKDSFIVVIAEDVVEREVQHFCFLPVRD